MSDTQTPAIGLCYKTLYSNFMRILLAVFAGLKNKKPPDLRRKAIYLKGFLEI